MSGVSRSQNVCVSNEDILLRWVGKAEKVLPTIELEPSFIWSIWYRVFAKVRSV